MSVYIKKIFKSKWVVKYGLKKETYSGFYRKMAKTILSHFEWNEANQMANWKGVCEMSSFLQSNNTFLFSFCVVATIICCDIFSLINHTATTRFLFSFFGKEEGVRDSQTKAIMQMFSTTSSSADLAKTVLPNISLS